MRLSGYSGKALGTFDPVSGTYSATPGVVAGTDVKLFEQGTKIVLADYVEAQHDFAEADGPTAATLAFVNARRAVGRQPAVSYTVGDPAIMAELRNQRGRDLFMGGFRLGDLRRWKRLGVGAFFPTGPHVNVPW